MVYNGVREKRRRKGTHTLAWITGISPPDFEQSEGPKYANSSAMYWELYGSEAEINNQKFVTTLPGVMKSMVILVSSHARASHSAST